MKQISCFSKPCPFALLLCNNIVDPAGWKGTGAEEHLDPVSRKGTSAEKHLDPAGWKGTGVEKHLDPTGRKGTGAAKHLDPSRSRAPVLQSTWIPRSVLVLKSTWKIFGEPIRKLIWIP